MAVTETSLRNIGIIAHVDAGKTTLSERILYFCHVITRMGEVNEGTTVLDFLPEEQQRGITIGAACISCSWKDTRINLVDTPGHIDFTFEVDRIVRVIDGALVVFSAVEGVEPQSEMVWRQADEHKLPRLVFINKVDRREADALAVTASIARRLHVETALLTIPLYGNDPERTLLGIIDVVRLEALYFDEATFGANVSRKPLFGQARTQAQALQDQLLERLAAVDDTFLEAWVNGNWTPKDLMAGLFRASQEGRLIPVYCGSAKKNIGIQCLLDGVLALLPKPSQAPNAPKTPDTVGFVFKVVFHGDTRVAWIRLYSGRLENDALLTTSSHPTTQARIRLYRIDAEQILEVDHAEAGDIVAVTGLLAQTGDTVTSSGLAPLLAPLAPTSPVLFQTLEPENAAGYGPLIKALERYCVEDPSLSLSMTESGSCMLSGMGELHLAVVVERLAREYHLTVRTQSPCVVVRDSIAREATARVAFADARGTLALTVQPRKRGSGNAIRIPYPQPLAEPLHAAITRVLARGITYGPILDTQVTVQELTLPDTCPDEIMLDRAAEAALTEALHRAQLIRLEPIMHLAITCPPDSLGGCLQELKRVNARVVAIDERRYHKVVHAEAALADIRDVSTQLRSATRGRASLLTSFARFDHRERESSCPSISTNA